MGDEGVRNSFSGDNSGYLIQAQNVRLDMANNEVHQARRRLAEVVLQLFDGPSVLRTGALDELEALGCGFPDLRQAVVDALCAFLRDWSRTDAGQACGKAQEILSRRLSAHDFHQGRCSRDELELWRDVRLDLRGALLRDFSFMDAELDQADFSEVEFHGDTMMSGMRVWNHARFDGAVFQGFVSLRNSSFRQTVTFTRATFEDVLLFHKSTFECAADFEGAVFRAKASFLSASFAGDARFTRAVFHRDAQFETAEFRLEAVFANVDFRSEVSFERAVFHDLADFTGVDGSRGFCFSQATLPAYLHHRVPLGWALREHQGEGYILPMDEEVDLPE